jgi:hypothetical protein
MRALLAAALLLVGLAGASREAVAGSTAELIALLDKMGGADQGARYPAFTDLQQRRDPAVVPLLVDRVSGWDLSAQSFGASLLDGLPGTHGLAGWKALLTSPSAFLRGCAGLRTHSSDPVKGAKVLSAAIEAAAAEPGALSMLLARMGGFRDRAVQATVRGLLAQASDAIVLGAALSYLALAKDLETIPLARDLAAKTQTEPAKRALLAAWLLRVGEQEHGSVLAELLAAGDVPYSDFLRLKPWLTEAEHLPDAVLTAVLQRLEKEETAYYIVSMIDLLGHAHHAPAVPVLRRLLDHTDATIGKAAFEALSALGALDSESLQGHLTSTDPERRLAAAEALRRADDHAGLGVVLDLARAGSPQRREAVRVLGAFRSSAAVETLIDALIDDDLSTRANAYNGLSETLRMLFPYRRLDFSTTGYETNAAPAARSTGAAVIRAWWQAHKDKRW